MMQHLQPNTTLQGGKYRIERVLGQGGFGITYLVDQTGVHKQLVVKELFIRGVNDRADDQTKVTVSNAVNVYSFSQQREKFKKEAMRLFELRNPHIVRIYDFFEENDTAYYVMEYIKGKSLADKLKSASLSESTMEKYMSHMLDALSAIHGKHLWHLDIKPANIMICDGNAVLIDFGASKHIDSNSTLTTSSAIAYTPGFAAPEQLDGDITKFGPWTDFYALGATMYQLLTLNRPPSFSEIFTKGKNAFVFSGISEKMQHLILWMMKPNRMERPQSVSNVISYFCKEDNEILGVSPMGKSSDIHSKQVVNEDEIRHEAYNLELQLDENLYQKKYFFIGAFGGLIGLIVGLQIIEQSDPGLYPALLLSFCLGFLAFWYPIRIYVHFKGKDNIKKYKEQHPSDPRSKYL